MTNSDPSYSPPKDAGAGYGGGKDAATGYADSKDGGGYSSPADAGVKQSASLFGSGVNLQPSYSSNGNADLGWDYLKKALPAIKTVRILVEPDRYGQAVRWVTEAQDRGYDVILCYNKSAVLGSSNPADLLDAAAWWKDHYAQVNGRTGITVNLMNEWGDHGLKPEIYADACNQALAIVRQVYKDRVILDAPGWGQGATALLQALTGSKKIADRNIMLSVHVYPSAYDGASGKALQNDALKKLNDAGLPCMLGEFGSKATQPSGASWNGLVDFAKSMNWPVLAWCWAADNTGGPGDPNQIDMNMVESPAMIQQKKAGQFVEFDPLVGGKVAPYATSSYFKEVSSKL
jgi:mannan endo-1,4-beta-mannosidase